MLDSSVKFSIRQDCLISLRLLPNLLERLAGQRIAILGGTGFVGTWIAEAIAAVNDECGAQVQLDLIGRSAATWTANNPHLAGRNEISVRAGDVRSHFELARDTTLVLYAAGIADPRVHASNPLLVQDTALSGIARALAETTRLERLQRFVNLSSGLVLGPHNHDHALRELDIGVLDFTRAHNVYAESRRAAENLVGLYASQFRIPVSTARAFTFIGPHQPLHAPWALNNFIRDALAGNDIRLHGDGSTRRSYLYGSDVASWLLKILVDGKDGEIYNLGGSQPFSHAEIANVIASYITPAPKLIFKSEPIHGGRRQDFFPDLTKVQLQLGLKQAFNINESIGRAMHWYASRLDLTG